MNSSNATSETGKTGFLKKGLHLTEILMLKSIVLLLILTFFLLNEIQAESISPVKLNNQIDIHHIENTQLR